MDNNFYSVDIQALTSPITLGRRKSKATNERERERERDQIEVDSISSSDVQTRSQ